MHVWKINPLPDLLADSPNPNLKDSQQIQEVMINWAQFVSSLWNWRDEAQFAIKYIADQGRTSIFLLALADGGFDEQLEAGIGVILRAFRLSDGIAEKEAVSAEVCRSLPHSFEVRQFAAKNLWSLQVNATRQKELKQKFNDMPESLLHAPPLTLPWPMPSGPFLTVLESMISQGCATSYTAHLRPTSLTTFEREWLSTMAMEASSGGEKMHQAVGMTAGTKAIDPTSAFAGQLYLDSLKRLVANPFLVSVVCQGESEKAARGVASAFQSIVQGNALARSVREEKQFASACEISIVKTSGFKTLLQNSEAVSNKEAALDELWRFPYLLDAGRATLAFRLPLNLGSGIPGIAVKQRLPDFHPGPRLAHVPEGHVSLGAFRDHGFATIPLRDLTRHVLIAGFTGSGKTVTVFHLLRQLWRDHKIPFLVVESAKHEYRRLIDDPAFQDTLEVYTLGNEHCSPPVSYTHLTLPTICSV